MKRFHKYVPALFVLLSPFLLSLSCECEQLCEEVPIDHPVLQEASIFQSVDNQQSFVDSSGQLVIFDLEDAYTKPTYEDNIGFNNGCECSNHRNFRYKIRGQNTEIMQYLDVRGGDEIDQDFMWTFTLSHSVRHKNKHLYFAKPVTKQDVKNYFVRQVEFPDTPEGALEYSKQFEIDSVFIPSLNKTFFDVLAMTTPADTLGENMILIRKKQGIILLLLDGKPYQRLF